MKFNKIFLVGILMLTIITLGAVSAAEDAGNLTISDDAGEFIESPVDEIDVVVAADEDIGSDELGEGNEIPMDISISDDILIYEYFSTKVTVPEDAIGKVSLFIDDNQQYCDYDEDGVYFYEPSLDEFGQHTFKAVYTAGEGDVYCDTVKEVPYYLNNTQYKISLFGAVYGSDLIYFYAPSQVRSDAVITVNGKKYASTIVETDEDYRWAFPVSDLKFGDNEVTVYYPGDEDFAEYSKVQIVNVGAEIVADTSIDVTQIANITLILPNDATGKLTAYSREETYNENYELIANDVEIASTDIKDGNAVLSLDLPMGYNLIYANFTGNYEVEAFYGSIAVAPKTTIPKAIVAGEDSYVTVEVSKGVGGTVEVSYRDNDVGDWTTIESGNIENNQAKISLATLSEGTYDINVKILSDNSFWETPSELYVVDSLDFDVEIIDYQKEIFIGDEDSYYVGYYLPIYAEGNIILKIDGNVVNTKVYDFYDSYLYFYANNLTLGEHTLTIDLVSDTQKNSSNSVKFNIIFAKISIPDKIIENYEDENYYTPRIFVGYSSVSSGNIVFLLDNEEFKTVKFDDSNSDNHYFTLPDVPRGTHNVTIIVNDDKYGSFSQSNTVDFDYVFSSYSGTSYGEDSEIRVVPPAYLGNGDLIITVDGVVQNWTFNQRIHEISFKPSNLSYGLHKVVVKYTGDDLYPPKEQNFTFGTWADIKYPYDNLVVGTEGGISLLLPSDAKGSLNVSVSVEKYDDDEGYYYAPVAQENIPLVNGKAYYSFKGLNAGYYWVLASYVGDDYEVTDADLILCVVEEGINWGDDDLVLGENKTVTFISGVNDGSALKLTLYRVLDPYQGDWKANSIVIENLEIPIVDGKASYTFNDLTLGNYYLLAECENAPEYQEGQHFIVQPTKAEVKYGEVYGDNNNVFIELPDDATGKAILTIHSDYKYDYLGPIVISEEYDVNGSINIALPSDLPSGRYGYLVNYTGNYGMYYEGYWELEYGDFDRFNQDMDVNTCDVTVGEDAVIDISFSVLSKGDVIVTIGDKTYNADIINGKGSVIISDLKAGNHTAVVKFSGDRYFKETQQIVEFKVNKIPTNSSDSPFKPDGNKTQSNNPTYSISMPSDATGNLTVTIANKSYTKELVNGSATIEVTDLPCGTYDAIITYSGDDKYESLTKTENVTVTADPIIVSKDITYVLYTAKGKYSVTVYGNDGKVASGVEVVFDIKGSQVKKVTDENGVAKYTVTKVPGTYNITATALGVTTTKTLKVKHLVSLKQVTPKRSAKKLVLVATLKKVNGKYLKKKTVTFKFKGKTYKAKTNSKGVAKVTIKSSVLKKLKVGKKITYQATYLKDTVKKTVKVKK